MFTVYMLWTWVGGRIIPYYLLLISIGVTVEPYKSCKIHLKIETAALSLPHSGNSAHPSTVLHLPTAFLSWLGMVWLCSGVCIDWCTYVVRQSAYTTSTLRKVRVWCTVLLYQQYSHIHVTQFQCHLHYQHKSIGNHTVVARTCIIFSYSHIASFHTSFV